MADTLASSWAVTLSGLIGNEALDVTADGQFDSANAGNRTASAVYSLANGSNGGLASNYSLADTSGHGANIGKATLTATANDDSKTANGQPYSGGNGVQYSGFVNAENSTVVGGSLQYGGTAQGAAQAGEYAITVGGLQADNYTFDYVNGRLLIQAPAPTPTPTPTPTPATVRDSLPAGNVERPVQQNKQAMDARNVMVAAPDIDINRPALGLLTVAANPVRLEE